MSDIATISQQRDAAVAALKAIASALDAPKNRFGKIEITPEKCEALRSLAFAYNAAPTGDDVVGLAVNVANCVVGRLVTPPPQPGAKAT